MKAIQQTLREKRRDTESLLLLLPVLTVLLVFLLAYGGLLSD
jgi:hypothetical protein